MEDDWIVRRAAKIKPGDVVYPLTFQARGGIWYTPQTGTVVNVTPTHIELDCEGRDRYFTMDTLFAVRP